MSSSPADSDWLEESLPLPQAGLIWPWIVAGMFLFSLGLWLLYPTQEGPVPGIPEVAHGPVQQQPVVGTETPRADGELDFVVVDSATSSFGKAAEQLAREMRSRTKGEIDIAVHTSGSFGGKKLDELAIIDAVRQGRAQLAIVTSSPLSNLAGDFEVLDLPFLFHSYEQADRVTMGPIGQKLLRGLDKEGLVGLGTLEVGFRVFSSSMPLPTMGDFNGRRVRVMQSAMSISMARMLGCEAVPSAVDKIYEMGKMGYIDAADRTYPTYWDFKLYEVQHYITESRHSYTMKVIIMNRAAYDALSEENRKVLQAAVDEVQGEQRRQQRIEDQRVKQECRRMGIQIFELSELQRKRFLDACKPLYDEFVKLHGSEMLEAIRKEAAPPQ